MSLVNYMKYFSFITSTVLNARLYHATIAVWALFRYNIFILVYMGGTTYSIKKNTKVIYWISINIAKKAREKLFFKTVPIALLVVWIMWLSVSCWFSRHVSPWKCNNRRWRTQLRKLNQNIYNTSGSKSTGKLVNATFLLKLNTYALKHVSHFFFYKSIKNRNK